MLSNIIPGAVQVKGSMSDEAKEEAFLAFSKGQIKRLVTKPKIGAWGLNFQNCNHETFFPSHSYEQFYQGVRRCWRFGQKKKVTIDIVTTPGERPVLDNMKRKAAQADVMFSKLVELMNDSLRIERGTVHTQKQINPGWLSNGN
jgi:hypothetical protein